MIGQPPLQQGGKNDVGDRSRSEDDAGAWEIRDTRGRGRNRTQWDRDGGGGGGIFTAYNVNHWAACTVNCMLLYSDSVLKFGPPEGWEERKKMENSRRETR